MHQHVNGQAEWDDIRKGILREPLIAYGMTVRLANRDDAEAVAGLVPEPASRSAPPRRAVAERLIADGTLYLVRDDAHEPMGIVRIRDGGAARAEVGWRLAGDRLGKGLGSLLVEGVTERLLRSGAVSVACPLAPGAHGARRTLQVLGYAPRDPSARPVVHEVDALAFAARRRRGIALLPTPAERRRGPSPNEQGTVTDGDAPRPHRPAPHEERQPPSPGM